MPELPEVETICRGLRPRLKGRTIRRVTISERRLRIPVEPQLAERLAGQTIENVERRAKYILIRFRQPQVWLFHLGMSGKLIHVDRKTPRQKHDHIAVLLDNGAELRYHDPRRFGLSLLVDEAGLAALPQLRRLGPDPFDRRFDGDYLYALTRKSDRRIRDLLLDQRVIAGIGNIYANEVLYRVHVRPTARCRRLTRPQVQRIAAAIPEVLNEAIRWCGTSFSDYRDADDRIGAFQDHLGVYDREGERCRRCPSTVKRLAAGNRSVFYCPSCQL